jgi:hypothetical protein
MVSSRSVPVDPESNRTTLLEAFGNEYKILQDKIDKIGAFRVTIKGWSVTATVGGLVAIASNKGLTPSVSAMALDVLLLFFFLFERDQVRLGWKFNGRARNIEIQIDKLRRAAGESVLFSTPNIARSLFGAKKRPGSGWPSFKNPTLEKWRLQVIGQIRLAIGSELVFYAALGLASWLPIWLGSPVQPAPAQVVIQNTIQIPKQQSPVVVEAPANSVPPSHSNAPKGGEK